MQDVQEIGFRLNAVEEMQSVWVQACSYCEKASSACSTTNLRLKRVRSRRSISMNCFFDLVGSKAFFEPALRKAVLSRLHKSSFFRSRHRKHSLSICMSRIDAQGNLHMSSNRARARAITRNSCCSGNRYSFALSVVWSQQAAESTDTCCFKTHPGS